MTVETDLRDLMGDVVSTKPKSKRKVALEGSIFSLSQLVTVDGLSRLVAMDELRRVAKEELDLDGETVERFVTQLFRAIDAPSPNGKKSTGHLVVRDAADIETRDVEWLMEQRIPIGMLTMVIGDPGVGKSFVTLALGTAVTRGDGLGLDRERRTPGDVLMMNYEDPDEEVTVPRANTFGHGPGKLLLVDGVYEDEGEDKQRLLSASDLHMLEDHLLANRNIRLLVIDPIGSYIPGKIDAFRDNAVRDVLSPLAALAGRYHVAIVAVMHLNKDQLKQVLYRAGGSIAFIGVPRSVLLAGKDPDTSRRGLAQVKNSLLPEAVTVEYTIDGDTLTWQGYAPELTKELLTSTAKTPTKRLDAKEWLRTKLLDKTVPVTELKVRADEAGHKWATIRRAADEMPEIVKRQPGAEGQRGRGPGGWTIFGGDDAR